MFTCNIIRLYTKQKPFLFAREINQYPNVSPFKFSFINYNINEERLTKRTERNFKRFKIQMTAWS